MLIFWLLILIGPATVGPSTGAAAELVSDIEYAAVDGQSLQLDASTPEGEGPFPMAILIHGGGWSGGDKAREHRPPVAHLTESKFTWFSINYRLAPEHRWPACIEDVRSAIAWVKRHAAQYKGDPSQIALIGYSAGGHLAAFAATTADDDTRPRALVILAGPTDLVADCERRGGVSPALQALFGRDAKLDDEAIEILRQASPLTHLTHETPPCLLIHGTADASVPYAQSVNFQAKLNEMGVVSELITIPGGEHSMQDWKSLQSDHRQTPDYEQKLVQWLRKVLTMPQ